MRRLAVLLVALTLGGGSLVPAVAQSLASDEVRATRPAENGEMVMRIPLAHALPSAFLLQPPPLPDDAPLWVRAWQSERLESAGDGVMLAALTAILVVQESFVPSARASLSAISCRATLPCSPRRRTVASKSSAARSPGRSRECG